jgi:hypothetical protein
MNDIPFRVEGGPAEKLILGKAKKLQCLGVASQDFGSLRLDQDTHREFRKQRS